MSPARLINLVINGERVSVEVEDNWTLLRLLRDELALTGTKEGCARGECGACTVIVDGLPVNACLVLAREVEGLEIVTIEGEGRGRGAGGRAGTGGEASEVLSPLQQAFIDHGALQCGFCTAGMIMSARALLMRNADPTEAEVKEAISGNLCRCTGYQPIVEAILDAAYRERNGGERVQT